MTERGNTLCPKPFYGGGIKKTTPYQNETLQTAIPKKHIFKDGLNGRNI
jgi:hypothetical protein